MSKVDDFLTKQEEDKIVSAIQKAEKNTSGEIKVHIENYNIDKKPFTRAEEVFIELKIHQTESQNGVLFYVDVHHKAFVVLGDQGIDKKVSDNFWESTKDIVLSHFKNQDFCTGLCKGIEEAGFQLQKYFPYQSDDRNELSDEISKN
ncbi:MAG: TPM domain-containing protein [Flavobacteriales bacterium]|jgi:uncharacterized membrane protein|nr:TPM domain-containing protein [Flavobacteriales bacterium]